MCILISCALHCRPTGMATSHHGCDTGHTGYPQQEEAANNQLGADRITPSTAPGGLSAGPCSRCVSLATAPCGARPMAPRHHWHGAGHAGYPSRQDEPHQQRALGCTTHSTEPGAAASRRPLDPVVAGCVHTNCALPCPPRDSSTLSRAICVPAPPGDSPPQVHHRPFA